MGIFLCGYKHLRRMLLSGKRYSYLQLSSSYWLLPVPFSALAHIYHQDRFSSVVLLSVRLFVPWWTVLCVRCGYRVGEREVLGVCWFWVGGHNVVRVGAGVDGHGSAAWS